MYFLGDYLKSIYMIVNELKDHKKNVGKIADDFLSLVKDFTASFKL